MKAIINGTIYTPTRLIPDGVILIERGKVLAVGSAFQVPLPEGVERVDARQNIICPGFVDMHLHGGDGADATDGTIEAVRALARRHLRAGTTSLAPSTASAPLPQIWRSFDCIGAVKRQPGPGEARVLGIHMEGPFFALSQRGAHHPDMLRMPNAAERERLYSYVGDLISLTIAPEKEGALEIIAYLSQRGVLIAGGHSDALYEQVCAAMNVGLRHITHLWSGMSTVRRIGPKRHAGMLEAGLVEEGLTAEIIADGYHLPSSLMKMAFRLKGPEKLCLVSDAMRASGLGPGEYAVGGGVAIVDEGGGVAITQDRQAFAGSISTVHQCVQQIVQVVGLSLGDALQMATLTPARVLGVDDRVGRLASGYPADLLLLDRASLQVLAVLFDGEPVGEPEKESWALSTG